jgi:hypothetical protein
MEFPKEHRGTIKYKAEISPYIFTSKQKVSTAITQPRSETQFLTGDMFNNQYYSIWLISVLLLAEGGVSVFVSVCVYVYSNYSQAIPIRGKTPNVGKTCTLSRVSGMLTGF